MSVRPFDPAVAPFRITVSLEWSDRVDDAKRAEILRKVYAALFTGIWDDDGIAPALKDGFEITLPSCP